MSWSWFIPSSYGESLCQSWLEPVFVESRRVCGEDEETEREERRENGEDWEKDECVVKDDEDHWCIDTTFVTSQCFAANHAIKEDAFFLACLSCSSIFDNYENQTFFLLIVIV